MERTHIGIFGKVNAGKSSIINAIMAQRLAVVSDEPGTTTDPVRKAMEILPIGPVMIYDTAGLSDESTLGTARMEKTLEVLRQTDCVLIIIDASYMQEKDDLADEKDILSEVSKKSLPFLVILNKADKLDSHITQGYKEKVAQILDISIGNIVEFSALKHTYDEVYALRERIASEIEGKSRKERNHLVSDLIEADDTVIMVVPIDEAAPKGRIILPQQQVLRDILDTHAMAYVCQPSQLKETLRNLKKAPKLVITDSQAFAEIEGQVPKDVGLTSFSILMARYKGDLEWQAAGAERIDELSEGASILISEGCTHHRQCGDIGTVKLPAWIKKYTGKEFDYHFTGGGEFPKDLSRYGLVIHCGGCTLPPREMEYRINAAKEAGVAITNYGTMIAYLYGILERAIAPLKDKY